VSHERNFAQLFTKQSLFMAKSTKKASPKAAKKSTVKAKNKKPVAKIAKKAAPKKAAKPAKKEKAAAKPKVVAKKAAKPVSSAKPAAKAAKAPVQKVVSKPAPQATTTSSPLKAAPSALNIFPNTPQQRPIAHRPVSTPSTTVADNRTRYSDEELKEFENLINQKLDKAKGEYKILKDTLNRNNDEGTDATSGGNTKVLEDGAETAEKENMSQLAARQQKYIQNLENALVRIKNGTYGICSVTGKLISKERLMAVPHTTQSIEAKMLQQD
jgi:RNA polymerase-binding transcription factor DksA